MSNINLYQIAYSQETLDQIEPGYKVLDNLENLRPDWYEYWPIRNFLMTHELNEDDFYGFFSPKFKYKTNLSYQQTYDFVSTNIDLADIFLFSPQFDMGAFFINVFEQGEVFDPGFIDTFNNFLKEIEYRESVNSIIMDSSEIVFSNYFVAKIKFWREWLKISELLFVIAEDTKHVLSNSICHPTSYSQQAQRKVFILERIASLIISTNKFWRVKSKNPITMAWSALPTNQFVREAIISDALKKAYKQTMISEYLFAFNDIRKAVFKL